MREHPPPAGRPYVRAGVGRLPRMEITGTTRVYCVLGYPVAHSLSPAMHNAALRALKLPGIYVPFAVPPHQLAAAVRGLAALGCGGANCTIPHKEAVLPLVDELTEDARAIGAVNTLRFQQGRITGHNTDAAGFLGALRAAGFEPAGRRALVLGAGGSARAVVVALVRAGAAVLLANRTAARATELAARFGPQAPGGEIPVVPWEADRLEKAARSADLLVNTTSLGMHPHEAGCPPVPEEGLHSGLFVYDLIYNPLETELLRRARARGARGTHGAGMLAHQGALALEYWTGRPAPVALMARTVLERLEAGGQGSPANLKNV